MYKINRRQNEEKIIQTANALREEYTKEKKKFSEEIEKYIIGGKKLYADDANSTGGFESLNKQYDEQRQRIQTILDGRGYTSHNISGLNLIGCIYNCIGNLIESWTTVIKTDISGNNEDQNFNPNLCGDDQKELKQVYENIIIDTKIKRFKDLLDKITDFLNKYKVNINAFIHDDGKNTITDIVKLIDSIKTQLENLAKTYTAESSNQYVDFKRKGHTFIPAEWLGILNKSKNKQRPPDDDVHFQGENPENEEKMNLKKFTNFTFYNFTTKNLKLLFEAILQFKKDMITTFNLKIDQILLVFKKSLEEDTKLSKINSILNLPKIKTSFLGYRNKNVISKMITGLSIYDLSINHPLYDKQLLNLDINMPETPNSIREKFDKIMNDDGNIDEHLNYINKTGENKTVERFLRVTNPDIPLNNMKEETICISDQTQKEEDKDKDDDDEDDDEDKIDLIYKPCVNCFKCPLLHLISFVDITLHLIYTKFKFRKNLEIFEHYYLNLCVQVEEKNEEQSTASQINLTKKFEEMKKLYDEASLEPKLLFNSSKLSQNTLHIVINKTYKQILLFLSGDKTKIIQGYHFFFIIFCNFKTV